MSDLFKPYYLTRWDPPAESPALSTPCLQNGKSNIVRDPSENGLYKLNNVDIVLTSDKSKWSRCIVVESSAPYMYETLGLPTAAGDDYDPGSSSDTNFNPNNFDVRRSFSVGKEDADGDGLPDVTPSEELKIDLSLDAGKFNSVTGFRPSPWNEMVKRMAAVGMV